MLRSMRGFRALASVAASPALRNLQLAWVGSTTGEFAYAVALSVYAYEQGGATAVGLVWLLRMIPSAVGAPLGALVADRFPRERVMLVANLVRAAATGVTALAVALDLASAAVYAPAVVVAVVSTLFWPVQAALLPALARTPEELTAANAASMTLEGLGTFAGPALCGALLALAGIAPAFAAVAVVFLAAAVALAPVRAPLRAERERREALPRALASGFRASLRPRVRLLVGVYGAWALVTGALAVLVVVAAFELLGLDEVGVGLLNAAIGVGTVLGVTAALGLVGSQRLGTWLGVGLVVWSAPLALLGGVPEAAAAVVLMGVLGAAIVLVDTAALTLVQRVVPEEALVRVLGIVEGLWVGSVGLGAAAASGLVAAAGPRGALVAAGLVLPVTVAVTWPSLRALDPVGAPAPEAVHVLRGVPFLGLLPAPALERLAARAVRVAVPAGETVVRQGEPGDRFYVIERGRAVVAVDGRERTLEPGDWFGEIALLHDVPRTATVAAASDLAVLALERDDFRGAVSLYPLRA